MIFLVINLEKKKKMSKSDEYSKKIFEFINDINVKDLKCFIESNNISVKKFKDEKDILTYSIINNSTLEIIRYIISLYKDLNYCVNCRCNINRSRSSSISSDSSNSLSDSNYSSYSNDSNGSNYSIDSNDSSDLNDSIDSNDSSDSNDSIDSNDSRYFNSSFNFNRSRRSNKSRFLINISPLCLAIVMERFDISDLLISSGANIDEEINYRDNNYNHYDNSSYCGYYGDYYVFDYLLKENLLTPNNLKYILDKNSKIGHLSCRKFDKIFFDKVLLHWIESSDNELLDTLFEHFIIKHINEEKFSFILKKYLNLYLCAIKKKNYDAIEILINYDIRRKNKEDTLNEIIHLFYVDISDYYDEVFSLNKNPENKKKSEKKIKKFIKSIKNEYLKDKITNIMEIEKQREDINNILKKKNYSELENYYESHSLKNLKNLKSYCFDILISAIEFESPLNIILLIINKLEYESFDYVIENTVKFYDYSMEWNTPLLNALSKNRFDITDVLLNKGADINLTIYNEENIAGDDYYKDESIFNYLYINNLINSKNLKYIINIFNDKEVILEPEFIFRWIFEKRNDLLKIYFEKYIYSAVKDKYYHDAITYRNYEAILILYENEKRNKDNVLYRLYQFFDFHNTDYTNSKMEFLNILNDFDENPLLRNIILEGFNQIQKNIKKREKTFRMIEQNDKDALTKYFTENNIQLEEINNFDWDILIYAIENDVSMEIIQFLVQKYEECNLSFNYGVELDIRYVDDDVISSRFENPLHLAIAKNNSEVVNLLMEKGADINFEI